MSASAKQVERPRVLRPPHLHDGRYPYIDSLRAIAALSIVVFHFAGYMTLPEQMEWMRPLVVRLGTGVLVFFVISGFLIYRPFVRANLMGTPRPEVIGYAKRRFLRIVPAYFLALTVTAALVGKTDVFGPDGFLYFGFLQIYQSGMELKGLSVAWSLCIEVTLYAFLPIWAAIVALVPARNSQERNAREAFMLVALLVGGVLARVLLTNSQGRVDSVSILGYLDIFALGMVLAYWSVAWENRPVPRWLSWINSYPGISWLIAGICLWAMATQTGPSQSAFQAASGTDLWLRHILAAGVGVFLVLAWSGKPTQRSPEFTGNQ
jgi:peptidoglycan/LPS O-acetylase OafA/YrhL